MPLTLIERIETGRKLTASEFDQNMKAIEAAFNALEAAIGVALNADGTLKNGAVYTPDNLANNIVSLDKMATGAEWMNGRYLRYNPTTGVLQAWPIEKPTPYMLIDATEIQLNGVQNNTVLSSWTLENVPAGKLTVQAELHMRRDSATATGGTLTILANDVNIGTINTHFLQAYALNHQIPFSMLGYLANFGGGQLVLKIVHETQEAGFDVTCGLEDQRFARKALVVAGY